MRNRSPHAASARMQAIIQAVGLDEAKTLGLSQAQRKALAKAPARRPKARRRKR